MDNNSQKNQIKCFSAFITRFILCKGSLPTHPSDSITESKLGENVHLNKDQNDHISLSTTTTTAPGLVARLMGLDPIPELKWVPESDSFPRSKSVNSMDYLINFNSPSSNQQQHRRAGTSVSFREGSTGLCTQNHEYFIFFLDNVDENNELKSDVKTNEAEFEELKQRKTGVLRKNREKIVVLEKKTNEKKSLKVNDKARRVCTKPRTASNRRNVLAPVNQIIIPAAAVEVKFTEKKGSNQMVRKTEQARPLSVDTRRTISKSRPNSLHNRTTLDYQTLNNKRVPNDNVLKDEVNKKMESKTSNANEAKSDYTKMLSDVRKLTEEENRKEPNWVTSDEDLEEFSVEFEHQILDQMLSQMVHELIRGEFGGKLGWATQSTKTSLKEPCAILFLEEVIYHKSIT